MTATRAHTYGLTINAEVGWSAVHTEPNMSTLIKQSTSELWACSSIPHTVHYHSRGVVVVPDNAYLPWKRRTYDVHAPSYEATRFRKEN